jgi:hypothetical protein
MALQAYYPLNTKTREIRLLSLEPGRFADGICISLEHHGLSTTAQRDYEALSYVWGTGQTKCSVRLRLQNGQIQQMLIGENLFIALKYLRHEKNTRIIWADAICINQNDLRERSQQVAMMGDVYRCATRVVAWLGPEADKSTHALNFIRQLSSQVAVNWITFDIEIAAERKQHKTADGSSIMYLHAGYCEAIYHLVMRPWFERLWIIQEISIGKENAILQCGTDSIPWKGFLDAILCLHTRTDRSGFGDKTEAFLSRCDLIYKLAVIQTHGSIEHIRHQLAQAQCSDQRDRIYGTLNIVRDNVQELGITPDYTKTLAEVYKDTAYRWIDYYGQIGILSSCQMTNSTVGIPSWTPDWSTPLKHPPLLKVGHENPWDNVVPLSFPTDRTLRVYGVESATVREVFPLDDPSNGKSPYVFRDKLRNVLSVTLRISSGGLYKTGETMQEAVCRTLAVNNLDDIFFPPRKTKHQYSDCLRTIETLKQDTISDMTKHHLEVFRSLSEGRIYFTTEGGHIGMAPSSVQPSDIVCSLIGCSKPVLLRPTTNKANTQYRLVGECYVHGLMGHEPIFGEFPENYRQIIYYDTRVEDDRIRYLNQITNGVEEEDPRPRRREVSRLKQKALETVDIMDLKEMDHLKIWRDAGINLSPFEII